MKKLLFALLAIAVSPPLFAQESGTITSTQCVAIDVKVDKSTVGIQVTGTWTGTLQPQVSIQGQPAVNAQVVPSTSTTPQATITGNGVFYANVGGVGIFQVCGNTVASGTANIFLNGSKGVNAGTLSFGGGSIAAGTTGQPAVYTGANAVGSSPTISSDVYFASGRPWVDVQAKGAKGDCVTDDTAAFQSAINIAQGNFMDVYVPAPSGGCYIVKPPTTAGIFTVTSGNWRFVGPPSVIIRVGASSGDFDAWLGPINGTGLTNFVLGGMTFDWNTTNNTVNAGTITAHPRAFIRDGGACDNLTIQNSHFINVGNKQTILTACTHTKITDNVWDHVGGGAAYYDHSDLYIQNDGYVISNNRFKSSGVNSAGAVTAIELHGSGAVTGNVVENYENCMNVTGIESSDTVNGTITGNTCNGAYDGIDLVSQQFSAHTTGFGLRNWTLTGNAIRITQVAWTVNPVNGGAIGGSPRGVWCDGGNNLLMQNILVASNTVDFDLEGSPNAADTDGAYGIGCWDSGGSGTYEGIRFIDNTVRNSPAAGARWSASGTSIEFSGNTIINSGSNTNRTALYRSGIAIVPPVAVTDFVVKNNQISDVQATTSMVYGINFFTVPAGSTIRQKNNTVNVTGATQTAFLGSIVGAGPFNTNAFDSDKLVYQVSSLSAFTAPSAVVTGTTGTSYSYKFLIKDSNGNITGLSSVATVSAAAILNGSNFVTVTCPAVGTTAAATFGNTTPTCAVYRTASAGTPATVGLLTGCTALALSATCVDNGLAGDTTTPLVFAGTGALATLYTIPIPAYTIEPGKGLDVYFYWNHTGANSEAINMNYGSCSFQVLSATSAGKLMAHMQIFNAPNDTGHQVLLPVAGAAGVAGAGTCSVDSTAAQNLVMQWNGNAADTNQPEAVNVTKLN